MGAAQGLGTGVGLGLVGKVGQLVSKPGQPEPQPPQVILPPGVERDA